MRCLAVAVIAIRNSMGYLPGCLAHLWENGIEAAILDHFSTDGGYEFCRRHLGHGIRCLVRMPYCGFFSLREQLLVKASIIDRLDADWIIHQDDDERLESPRADESLAEALARAEAEGANCVNFDEFVFLPLDTRGWAEGYAESPYYYFFQPYYPRLMRAWKKLSGLKNILYGGHGLDGGELRRSAEDYVLRHYMFLSQAHAYQKYADRTFSRSELAMGWHYNRVGIDAKRLTFPSLSQLRRLPDPRDRCFDKSDPWKRHYWER